MVNTFHEGPRCLALPLTRGIILLFVLPFTGVKRRLDDRKQDVDERILEAVKLRTIRSKAKLLLHGMKSLCYGDPSAFNIEAFGNQEDHRGLSLAYGDNIQTD